MTQADSVHSTPPINTSANNLVWEDKNDIDNALHEIRQMVLIAINAGLELRRSDADPAFFQLLAEDSEMLSFALYDLRDRVDRLKDGLFAGGGCA